MTYFNTISHAIELIGNETFKNNEISIKLDNDASFFLNELDNRDWFSKPQINFDRIYDQSGVVGLKFKKTQFNSIGDQVNPEFLQTLKKASLAYLTALASNWRVSTNEEINHVQEFEMQVSDRESDPQDRGITREKIELNDNMGPVHCILAGINRTWGLKDEIRIFGYNTSDKIIGKWEDVKQFYEILRVEASGVTLLPLSTLICRQISQNLPAYQNQEKYKYLPNDLIEKIKQKGLPVV